MANVQKMLGKFETGGVVLGCDLMPRQMKNTILAEVFEPHDSCPIIDILG